MSDSGKEQLIRAPSYHITHLSAAASRSVMFINKTLMTSKTRLGAKVRRPNNSGCNYDRCLGLCWRAGSAGRRTNTFSLCCSAHYICIASRLKKATSWFWFTLCRYYPCYNKSVHERLLLVCTTVLVSALINNKPNEQNKIFHLSSFLNEIFKTNHLMNFN